MSSGADIRGVSYPLSEVVCDGEMDSAGLGCGDSQNAATASW